MSDIIKKVLATEYSERFDQIRKNMMVVSFYKYGPVGANYGTDKAINGIKSLERRLVQYMITGNTEFLADVANFAMIEFMYPQHFNAHYKDTDSDESPGVCGLGVNEAKRFMEDHGNEG